MVEDIRKNKLRRRNGAMKTRMRAGTIDVDNDNQDNIEFDYNNLFFENV